MYAQLKVSANPNSALLASETAQVIAGQPLSGLTLFEPESTVTNIIASGWEVWDANLDDATSQLLAAPHVDSDLNKFVELQLNSQGFRARGHSNWSVLNNTSDLSTLWTREVSADFSQGGYLYIAANSRFFAITTYSFKTAQYSYAILLAAEHTRAQPANVSDQHAAFCVMNTAEVSYSQITSSLSNSKKVMVMWAKNYANNVVTGTQAVAYLGTTGLDFLGGFQDISHANMRFPAGDNTYRYEFWPLMLFDGERYPVLGYLTLCDIHALVAGAIGNMETLDKDGQIYIAWPASQRNNAQKYEWKLKVRLG